jgi:hypothetical protein
MSADQEIHADSWSEPVAETAWPEIEPASEPSAAELEAAPELEAGLEPEPASAAYADAPIESEAVAAPEPAAAPESIAAPEPVVEAEPEPVLTESMAELYLGQGHAHEALTIYRELYLRHPDDRRLRDKVTALETAAAAADPGEPEAPQYAATGGAQSVAAMFHALLAARPAPAPKWSPVAPSAESAAPADTSSSTPASSEGEPTRPADDRLSLSAVFGDDSSPIPPAVPAGQAPADGMSFDAFFDAAPPAEPAPRRAAARDDDLDQFHAWLQNLKR